MKNFKIKSVFFLIGILFLFSCGGGATEKQNELFSAPNSGKADEVIMVNYTTATASKAPNRLWVTIVKKSMPDKTWGKWSYVADQSQSTKLTCPKVAGQYEIRLHDGFPTKKYHVIARQDFTVE